MITATDMYSVRDVIKLRSIMEINPHDVPDNLVHCSGCFGDLGTLPQINHVELSLALLQLFTHHAEYHML